MRFLLCHTDHGALGNPVDTQITPPDGTSGLIGLGTEAKLLRLQVMGE